MPTLSFQNITVTVPSVKGPKRYLPQACQKDNERKQILHSVNGKFPKKGLVAIMGPSGSGKTTFLNALSNRMSIGGGGGMHCSGIVKVNGQIVPPEYFYSKQVSFVPQDTCLFSELSPREAIRFSTTLVYPSLSAEKVEMKVNKILTALSLHKCADTQVGNEMFRGVSGGERKRTSIGVAIVNEPEVLFLDEPTTGLDTETAGMVVRSIQGLSSDSNRMRKAEEKQGVVVPHQSPPGEPEEQDGRIIIMTLHQPSSEIWEMLDHLVLLVQGHIIYNGPANQALDFFVSCGYARPLHVNPSDYFLDIVQCQEDEEAQAPLEIFDEAGTIIGYREENLASKPTQDKVYRAKYLAIAWRKYEKIYHPENLVLQQSNEVDMFRSNTSPAQKREHLREVMRKYNERVSLQQADGTLPLTDDEDNVTTFGTPYEVDEKNLQLTPQAQFKHELFVLTKRAWMTFTRTRLMIPLKFAQICLTAILIIVLFTPLGIDQISVLDRSGGFYLVIIIQIFATVLSVVMLFPDERGVYLNEQSSRLYSVSAYFISKLMIDIPQLFVTILGFALVTYFPIQLQLNFWKFIVYFLVMFAVAVCGHGLGLIVATAVASPALAALLAPMVIAPFILFSHVAIPGNPNQTIWWIFRPLQLASPFWWGLDALMINEFSGLTLECKEDQVFAVPSVHSGILYLCQFLKGEEVLAMYDIEKYMLFPALLILFVIAGVAITGSGMLLKFMSSRVASNVPMAPPSSKRKGAVADAVDIDDTI